MVTKHKTVSQLKKDLDKVFSRYIRYRDGKKIDDPENGETYWYTLCITSGEWMPFKKAQAGHFMSRRFNSTRYNEENVNGQSYRDNVLFYGEQYKYAKALDLKYGEGTAQKLQELAKETKQFKATELEEMIDYYKERVREYEEGLI